MSDLLIVSGVAATAAGLVALVTGSLRAMRISNRRQAAGLLLAGLVALGAGLAVSPGPDGELAEPIDGAVPFGAEAATVVRHVDGDTIWAEGGSLPPGQNKIRLLEVDTPEPASDCFGPEASEFTARQLPIGSTVFLLADRSDTDRFGRYLRYVFTGDGRLFNEELVRQGFATALLIQPDDRFIERIRRAESEAKSAGRGLWGACPTED